MKWLNDVACRALREGLLHSAAVTFLLFGFVLLAITFDRWSPSVGEFLGGSNAPGWIQAVGSILAVAATALVARWDGRQRDKRDAQRRATNRRALAIEIHQEVEQLLEELRDSPLDRIWINWRIPSFLSFSNTFRDYVDLGDEFIDCCLKLRELDSEKMEIRRQFVPDLNAPEVQAEFAQYRERVFAAVEKLERLVNASRFPAAR